MSEDYYVNIYNGRVHTRSDIETRHNFSLWNPSMVMTLEDYIKEYYMRIGPIEPERLEAVREKMKYIYTPLPGRFSSYKFLIEDYGSPGPLQNDELNLFYERI